MINKELKHVEDFHNAFGLDVAKKPTIDLSKETIKLRSCNLQTKLNILVIGF